ncbi:MAG: LysE family translocator [Halieaceae bacterium]|jgi:homoserine/homoserine lactone efflux protein|nr:LysE family translocator [Halieaceae bacterium]MBT6181455.1 LysE family translocator [Halieaceae bacterium]
MSADLILLFIPTIAAISFTPGLCMTLAFTLGLSIGYRRTLWMMAGELTGVTTVFAATFWSLGWLLSRDIIYFQIISLIGGTYLLYLAARLFNETPEQLEARNLENTRASALALLGFVTAVSNPKGWAFLLALLPGFVAADTALLPQFAIMLAIMLTTEFFSMTAYATGGQWLATRLSNSQGLLNANRVAASMLGLAALWVLSGTLN